MVAISLYRGNLHRSSDVPRRWLMPNPKISLKDFTSLLSRRSKALSRLHLHATTSSSNPNPKPPKLEPTSTTEHNQPELVSSNNNHNNNNNNKPIDDGSDSKIHALEKPSNGAAASTEKQTEPVVENNVDLLTEKEKRKKEVEDKLQVLNAKKHNLVLVLKQILNAEEELKRQNSVQLQQGVAMRGPSVLDGMNDTTGSMTRHMAPRLGSEGNLAGGDVDGGEADDFANHNMQHSRHMLRTSSMSPSWESPLRRNPSIQHNAVSLPSRATGSPSRFALSGHQGNPMNLPSLSVSGTSYIASSPSPAASGGTSVFRDARQPSPWK